MRAKFFALIFLAATGVALGQGTALQPPPIKMGLWEKTMETTGGAGGPATFKAKSCITPASWQEMVGNASKQPAGCTNNITRTAHGYSFSGSCNLAHVSSVFSGSSTIQDSEHIVSETHSTITHNGQKHESQTHSTSHYLGSNCGTVKPGEPEVEDD